MYAKVENGTVVAIGLPVVGTLKDSRTVSRFDTLGADILIREGWLPVIGEKPTYNVDTQQLQPSYTVQGNQVNVTYTVIARTPEPPTIEEKLTLTQDAVDFIMTQIFGL